MPVDIDLSKTSLENLNRVMTGGVNPISPWTDILSRLGGGGGSYAGLGAQLGSLAGPWGALIGGAAGGVGDIYSSIAGLFQPSQEGREKIAATKMQQLLEKWSTGIEKQVEQGTMDPAVALTALKNLASLANSYSMSGNDKDKAGMLNVLASINQQMANIQGRYNWELGRNVEEGTIDKTAAGGLTANFRDVGTQKDWLTTQLRNKLAGFTAGDKNLAGSPMEKIFKPAFDPYAVFSEKLGTVKQALPDYQEPSSLEQIRKRLEGRFNGNQ